MRAVLRRHPGRQPASVARVRPVVVRHLERPARPLPDRHRLLPPDRRHRAPLQRRAGLGDVELREGPRRRQEREHVLGGRDLAGRAAPPARSSATRGSTATGTTSRSSATSPGAARPTRPGSRRPRRPAATSSAGYYRFALFRNDRFEIGPTVGIGYLWLDARVQATGTIGRREPHARRERLHGQRHRRRGRLRERLAHEAPRHARGLPLHQGVAGRHGASVTDWRLGADYYFFRNAGLGVQYKYNKYTYDRGILVSELGGEVTYKGFQVFLSFLF